MSPTHEWEPPTDQKVLAVLEEIRDALTKPRMAQPTIIGMGVDAKCPVCDVLYTGYSESPGHPRRYRCHRGHEWIYA
jgi:hypothetical protein